MGFKQQALYCYRKVYSLDPTNVHALWDRALLAKDMKEFKIVGVLFITPHPAFFTYLHRHAAPFWPS
jgi:hypothetical protein